MTSSAVPEDDDYLFLAEVFGPEVWAVAVRTGKGGRLTRYCHSPREHTLERNVQFCTVTIDEPVVYNMWRGTL
jgi:hypothetical protein